MVAQRRDAEVAQPAGHPPRDERSHPAEDGDDGEDGRIGREEEQRRDGEQETGEHSEPALAGRRPDRQIDRVAPLAPDESGKRAADDAEECPDVRACAHEGGEETVEEARDAAEDEREQPRHDSRERGRDGPQREPDEVRDREQEAKRHEQPRPPEVVVHMDCDRVRRELGRRLDAPRGRIRIAVGEEERIRRGLGAVPDRVRRRVAQPARHPAAREAREPAEEGGDGSEAAQAAHDGHTHGGAEGGRACERRGHEERRHRQEQAEAGSEPSLAARRADLHVHRVRACSREARVGVGRKGQIGRQVGRVSDIGDEEAVQRRRRSALEQHGQPDDETERERGHAEQRHPDDVRESEHQPEEDGRAATPAVVGDDELHRVRPRPRVGRRAHARILLRIVE